MAQTYDLAHDLGPPVNPAAAPNSEAFVTLVDTRLQHHIDTTEELDSDYDHISELDFDALSDHSVSLCGDAAAAATEPRSTDNLIPEPPPDYTEYPENDDNDNDGNDGGMTPRYHPQNYIVHDEDEDLRTALLLSREQLGDYHLKLSAPPTSARHDHHLDQYDVSNILAVQTSRHRPKRDSAGRFPWLLQPDDDESFLGSEHVKIMEDEPSRQSTASEDLVPQTVLKDARPRLTGSRLLDKLGDRLIRKVVAHLCFPDAFTFAMTCHGAHSSIDLKHKKVLYLTQLDEFERCSPRSSVHGIYPLFCGVCLYRLPKEYYSSQHLLNDVSDRICMDCEDYRGRKSRSTDKRYRVVESPIWRPSLRTYVSADGLECGFFTRNRAEFWFRERKG